MKIFLQNISDRQYHGGSTIDIELSEHPISRPFEFTKYFLDVNNKNGEFDPAKASRLGLYPANHTKSYRIVIQPGETAEFGDKAKFNMEHAEYLYDKYGSPEKADQSSGEKNFNWLIEIDEQGQEVKGYLYNKYRAKAHKEIWTNPDYLEARSDNSAE